jgi:hypothetical protein
VRSHSRCCDSLGRASEAWALHQARKPGTFGTYMNSTSWAPEGQRVQSEHNPRPEVLSPSWNEYVRPVRAEAYVKLLRDTRWSSYLYTLMVISLPLLGWCTNYYATSKTHISKLSHMNSNSSFRIKSASSTRTDSA